MMMASCIALASGSIALASGSIALASSSIALLAACCSIMNELQGDLKDIERTLNFGSIGGGGKGTGHWALQLRA
jgi:hypothetical protein